MERDSRYVSSIPADARERITQKHGAGGPKRSEYYIGKELVGIRTFHRTGDLETETSLGKLGKHSMFYRWDEPGVLLSCEPYEDGLVHGTAYQWNRDGKIIGSYTMEHGTGVDLWWQDWEDGSVNLEV